MKYLGLEIILISLLLIFNVHARTVLTERSQKIEKLFPSDGEDINFGTPRKLDVYYNKKTVKKLKPVVIYYIGSVWCMGSKETFKNIGKTLKEYDYVGVLPDYVLFPFGSMDDMVTDVYKSIMWTRENIERYGGDPNDITIAAHSSGAHLTLLTLYKSLFGIENNGEKLGSLDFIKKLVLINGPYNFDDYSIIKQLFKQDIDNGFVETMVTQLFKSKEVSPTDIIRRAPTQSVSSSLLPKFIFVYSSLDNCVPPSSANDMMAEIERVVINPDLQYFYFEGLTHNTLCHGVNFNIDKYKRMFIDLIES